MNKTAGENNILFSLLGFTASAILLTVIQAPWNLSYLAPIAAVPFVLACPPGSSTGKLTLAAYTAALLFWLGNLYWIIYITTPAYIFFCLYLAVYWPVLAFCVRFLRQKWPKFLFISIPVVFLGAETIQSVLFTGFNWYALAHSQYANLHIIQIADIFGAGGVSFVIAMVNGLLCQIIINQQNKKPFTATDIAGVVVTVCVVLSTILYSNHRLKCIEQITTAGPLIGAVQPNTPSEIKEENDYGDELLAELIQNSEHAFGAGATFVAWPETMVLASLNSDYLLLCDPNSPPRVYNRQIAETAKDKGYILAGAHSITIDTEGDDYAVRDRYNSAFFYTPEGRQSPRRYDKIHLVPFGEFIPLRDTWLFRVFMSLNPYDYDYSLTKGTASTRFNIQDANDTWGFGVLICYEDTDPEVTRRMVIPDKDAGKAHWLVNISNDAWYVKFKDGRAHPSIELPQRTAISVFRAVENRISIIRSVNAGISCLIDPTGRIRDDYAAGTLPKKAMARQGVAGWFVDNADICSEVTFFTTYGRKLDLLCAASIIIIFIAAAVNLRALRRPEGDKK